MIVYGSIFSPYCARVALAARYKGIKHSFEAPVGGSYKSPAFLKMNPLGKVPTLVDGPAAEGRKSKKSRPSKGATVVFESAVIVEYLDAKSKKKGLTPKNAKDAAKARMIGAVVGDYVHNAVGKLFAHLGPNPDRAAVDAIFADIAKQLDIAEQVIVAKPFAAGAKFGIADVFALPSLTFASFFLPVFGLDEPLKGRKKLTAYMAKARKHKLMGGVIADMEAGFKVWRQSRGL
ncbi:MAG: glutathione S-transferase family protein [Rhodospirillaceae bacterium]|nr:glutathione S-transferase family protein [Rhodospirillaceae bacterium]